MMNRSTLLTADYPVELDAHIVLPNRTRLHIRPLRRCEEEPIRELDTHLSVRTRYLRFLSPLSMIPDSVVGLLASVDYRRSLALVAEPDGGTRGHIVALGSFGAIDDRSAEVSLLVRDDWQRQRIGTELAKRIIAAAESRGFHRFIVHVLSENIAIRRLLANVGVVVSTKVSGHISELAFIPRVSTT
jgi:RimJ/RimL family protein N-acetyltransferase